MKIENIDISAKHARATFIVMHGNEILFGLAIRRKVTNTRYRWCFYLGITEEEYSILVRNYGNDEKISFLGLPSDQISVPKSLSDVYFAQAPERFAGCHFDTDPMGANWSSPSIIACLEFFVEETLGKINKVKHASNSQNTLTSV